ncbi:MAG: glycosyltransferase family 39 protein, partial [Planctomycetaceae bacterium]
LILLITLTGMAARSVKLDNVAVEHFDEGVYSSNLLFPHDGFTYPDLHLYAPPLVPALIEWSIVLFGGQSAPLLPGVILGSLTVPLLWFVTRRWFGAAAGVAAACLLSLSDFHITLSRSALTDVPLVFFLLLAVWLIHEGVSRGRLGLAAAGGLATGLAWATKYNGWLPLAIAMSGTAGACLSQKLFQKPAAARGARNIDGNVCPSISGMITALCVATLTAAVIWIPVWNDLPHGYSEVSSNHSHYLVGPDGWLPSLIRHESIQRHCAGLATWLSGVLAAISAAFVLHAERSTWNPQQDESSPDPGSTWNSQSTRAAVMAATLSGAIVLSPLVMILVWSLVSFGSLILNRLREPGTDNTAGNPHGRCPDWFALWFCLAWLCGLLLSTPAYRAYPRLILPLQCVGAIGTGLSIVLLLTGQVLNSHSSHGMNSQKPALRFAWLVPVFVLCAWRGISTGAWGWQNRTEFAEIASRAAAAAAADCRGEASAVEGYDFVLYVYGEPGLLYHIPAVESPPFVRAVMDLTFTQPGSTHERTPTFVLAGPHALDSPQFQTQLAEAGAAMEEIDVFPYRASDFVLLDSCSPAGLEDRRAQLVRLYRVHFQSSAGRAGTRARGAEG